MALRCLIALKNSESRSGCRNAEPAFMRSARRRTRFAVSAFRRLVSTPAFDWEVVECRQLALELLQDIRTHVAACRKSQDVDQACHRRPATPGAGALVVVQGLVVEEVEPQEGAPCAHSGGCSNTSVSVAVSTEARNGLLRCGGITHGPIVLEACAARKRCARRIGVAGQRQGRLLSGAWLRRELEIARVQSGHLALHSTHVRIVADHVIRGLQPRGPRCLCVQDRLCLLRARSVARTQAPDCRSSSQSTTSTRSTCELRFFSTSSGMTRIW